MLAAEYRVTGDIQGFGGALYDKSTMLGSGVGGESVNTGFDRDIHVSSVADIGGLRASAYASLDGRTGDRAYSVASATYSDMVVSGLAGVVPVSLNVYLTGSLTAISETATNAGASVGVVFVVNGVALKDGSGEEASQLLESMDGTPTLTKTGVLAGWGSPGGVLTTPTFAIEAGVPFTLSIVLTSVVTGGGAGLAQANADFGHTLSFVTDAAVFNLPPGGTANSPDAGIVDNQFVVPEVSVMALTVFSAVLLAVGFCVRTSNKSSRLPFA